MASTSLRPMGTREWLLLVTLSILWGGSFFFGKVALADLRPFSVVLGRVGLAAVALALLVRAGGHHMPSSPAAWGPFLVMGALNNLIPFSLIFWGQTRIPSGLASILNATTPLFTVVLAHRLTRDERLTPGRLAGVLLGLGGVAAMIGPAALDGLGPSVVAQFACLGAALSYALAGLYGRRFRGRPPLVTAAGQVTASAILVLPVALVVDRPWTLPPPGPAAWGALGGLALLSTALAYVIYFRILAVAGATNLLLVTFLIPVSALLLGTTILGERLDPGQAGGMALIALGLAAVDGRPGAWLRTRLLFTLIAAIACGTEYAHGLARDERVRFQSGTYTDFRQVLTRAAPAAAVTVSGTLGFPDEAKDRYPAAVLVHTAGGYREVNEGWHAAELRKAGFATLVYDSFVARGMGDVAVGSDRGPPPYPSAVADAFAALQLLARHPKVDPHRIAIVGFSFGGEVAHLTAFGRIRAALAPESLGFAAHVAYYPAGVSGVVAEPGAYTGAPVLMLLAEKDDALPVAKAEAYLAYARRAGYPAPIEVVVYPGARHGWTNPGLGAMRHYPRYLSVGKCPLQLMARQGVALLVDGRERPFDLDSWIACLREGRGYTMAYDASVRARSTPDALAFLRRHLAP